MNRGKTTRPPALHNTISEQRKRKAQRRGKPVPATGIGTNHGSNPSDNNHGNNKDHRSNKGRSDNPHRTSKGRSGLRPRKRRQGRFTYHIDRAPAPQLARVIYRPINAAPSR